MNECVYSNFLGMYKIIFFLMMHCTVYFQKMSANNLSRLLYIKSFAVASLLALETRRKENIHCVI